MIDLTPILEGVISVCVALVTAFVIPWIKAKLAASKNETMKSWVKILVQAAEQMYKAAANGKAGINKKAYVVDQLSKKGYSLSVDEIDSLIESAVHELSLTVSETAVLTADANGGN